MSRGPGFWTQGEVLAVGRSEQRKGEEGRLQEAAGPKKVKHTKKLMARKIFIM